MGRREGIREGERCLLRDSGSNSKRIRIHLALWILKGFGHPWAPYKVPKGLILVDGLGGD